MSPATKVVFLTSANDIFNLLKRSHLQANKQKKKTEQQKEVEKVCNSKYRTSSDCVFIATSHFSPPPHLLQLTPLRGFAADSIFLVISRFPPVYSRGNISALFYLS